MSEPTLRMQVEQCRELPVELQQVRQRLTALEQVVPDAVQHGERAEQPPSEPTR